MNSPCQANIGYQDGGGNGRAANVKRIVKTVKMKDRIQNKIYKNEVSKATLAIAPS